jgi:hypothetical protein
MNRKKEKKKKKKKKKKVIIYNLLVNVKGGVLNFLLND